MFEDHPWYGEELGPIQYQWHLERSYCFNIFFELDNRPCVKFCKDRKFIANQLVMKIGARLSAKYLPQYVVGVSKRPQPARYPVGYVRKIAPDRDMVEFIAVREKDRYFVERWAWKNLRPLELWLAREHPRLTIWLAKHFFYRREMRNWFALMISRNPMAQVGFPIVFFGNNYWCWVFTIPYGDKVWASFGGPHAFANVDYMKDFLAEFKNLYEHPETIPQELLDKRYDTIELGFSEKER